MLRLLGESLVAAVLVVDVFHLARDHVDLLVVVLVHWLRSQFRLIFLTELKHALGAVLNRRLAKLEQIGQSQSQLTL